MQEQGAKSNQRAEGRGRGSGEEETRRVRGGEERSLKWVEEKRADMGVEWRETRGGMRYDMEAQEEVSEIFLFVLKKTALVGFLRHPEQGCEAKIENIAHFVALSVTFNHDSTLQHPF